MGGTQQDPSETRARYLAPEVQGALVQLAQAQDNVRHVLEAAGLLPAGTNRVSPAVVSTTNGHVAHQNGAVIPHWDPATRVLRLGGRIVKKFRVPSSTQEIILASFQEEGWPPCLDDPLPPINDGCPKDRLRDTIRHLNSNQKNRLIRFRGDGTGQGILWELIDGSAPINAVNGKQ